MNRSKVYAAVIALAATFALASPLAAQADPPAGPIYAPTPWTSDATHHVYDVDYVSFEYLCESKQLDTIGTSDAALLTLADGWWTPSLPIRLVKHTYTPVTAGELVGVPCDVVQDPPPAFVAHPVVPEDFSYKTSADGKITIPVNAPTPVAAAPVAPKPTVKPAPAPVVKPAPTVAVAPTVVATPAVAAPVVVERAVVHVRVFADCLAPVDGGAHCD
jgi:hypothetical protein